MPPSATQNEYKRNFTELDTEYLIGLWDKSTDDDFTPEALAALRQVIIERLGVLPSRGLLMGRLCPQDPRRVTTAEGSSPFPPASIPYLQFAYVWQHSP